MELLLTLFIPLIGAILLLFVNRGAGVLARGFAFAVSGLSFIVSLTLYFGFDHTNPDFQFVTNIPWIASIDAGFRVGIDGMGLLMVMLTTFITPIALLCSFDSIKKREKEYYIMVLLLQFAMTGVFVSMDIFLFYVFWELILIPMYFIIGIWGGKGRLYATVKFFIFTVVGSLFMLVAVVWLASYAAGDGSFTTDFLKIRSALEANGIEYGVEKWLFWGFAISFLIKVPLFPLHTWLPDAHTEAPTPGSVILAGVLLKMGTYGLIRFNLDLFPAASIANAQIISFLAVVGIVYGAIVAMIQTDIKKLVAYTSVSHLGFVVLGIFSMTEEGLQGAIIQGVNHGLSTGMLFLLIGIIYERRHTREISDYGGIARVMPAYTAFFGIAMFSSIGLPILNGFVGEFLTLVGAFTSTVLDNQWYAIVGTSGVIFAAVYLLWMFQRVFLGELKHDENKSLQDLTKSEWAMLVPIVVFIVWLGVYPNTFMKFSSSSTEKLVKKIEKVENQANQNLSEQSLIEYKSNEN
jgi:NADH-quinone oxidoreductase subunit M